jgi:2-aminoadipate transaminase
LSNPELSAMAQRIGEGDLIATIFNKVRGATETNPDFISLAAGPPDNDLLPQNEFIPLLIETQNKYGPEDMNYTRPAGFPPLCESLAAMLAEEQGVVCENPMRNMLITSGGMEAISMATMALVNPGDVVLVESPAFPGALSAFKLFGANIVHVECDEYGIIPEALEKAIAEHGPKLVSLMPDFQNPTGKLMPLERRKQIAQILIDTGTWAVEDGAYAQLRFAGERIEPIQAFAPNNVLYAASVSKSFMPAERTGALIGPAEFIAVVGNIKATYNMQASALLQALAAEFVSPRNTYLKEHLLKLRPEYLQRREAMSAALAKHLPNALSTEPDGGMFMWVKVEGANFTDLVDVAIEHGVGYVPGSMFYADETVGHDEVRLNFASTPVERIDEAIRRLAEAMKSKQ